MSESAPESTIVATNQGVMPGVEPAARVPSIQTASTNTPQRVNTPTPDAEKVFTAEDVERIRQQEKSKVYGRLEEMQQRLAVFEQEREQRLQAEQEAQRLAEEAQRKAAEAEMDTRTLLEQKEREWQERLEAERLERERAFALLEKEREFAALESYKQSKVRENEDSILPELLDEITGNTQDEIDASIARLVAKSASILENIGAVVQQQRQSQPSARVTAPPVGPLEAETAQQQLSAEDISRMSMDEYAQRRGQFGVTGGRTHRGLFG